MGETRRRQRRTRIRYNAERRGYGYRITGSDLDRYRVRLFASVQLLCGICGKPIPDGVWFAPTLCDTFVCADCVYDAAAIEAVYAPTLAPESQKG